jgi:hypothetical protein
MLSQFAEAFRPVASQLGGTHALEDLPIAVRPRPCPPLLGAREDHREGIRDEVSDLPAGVFQHRIDRFRRSEPARRWWHANRLEKVAVPAPAFIAFPPPPVRHNEPESTSRARNAPTFHQRRRCVRKRPESETADHGVEGLGPHRKLLSVHAREEDPRHGPRVRCFTCPAKHGLGQVNTDRQTPRSDRLSGGHERRAGTAGHIEDASTPGDPDAINEPAGEVAKDVRSNRPVGLCHSVEDTPHLRLVSAHSPMLTGSRPARRWRRQA